MQTDIDAAHPHLPVHICGVNQAGQESGNAEVCTGRTIPWLQETADHPCWTPWHVTYRDVVILDPQNRRAGVFNLTEHDLSVPANYDSLRAMILRVANR
jgi:hypothetical protein